MKISVEMLFFLLVPFVKNSLQTPVILVFDLEGNLQPAVAALPSSRFFFFCKCTAETVFIHFNNTSQDLESDGLHPFVLNTRLWPPGVSQPCNCRELSHSFWNFTFEGDGWISSDIDFHNLSPHPPPWTSRPLQAEYMF